MNVAKVYTPSNLGGVQFDAIISRDRAYEAEVPTYPVEDGYKVSDAVLRGPLSLSVTAFISNSPITWRRQLGNSQNRVSRVCKQLEKLYFSGDPVTFTSGNKVYRNMALVSLTIPENAEMMNAVEVSFQLQQVEITKSKTTTIPASYGASGTTGESGGTASTTEEKKEGFLSKACSLLFGLFKK